MKYSGFYFWMFKGSMKQVLVEKYDKAYAQSIMKQSKAVYRQLVEGADDIGDDNPWPTTRSSRWPLLRRMLRAKRKSRRKPCRR